jgi:hypothetical protein
MGYQYHFNKEWGSKIIIDGGRPATVGQITVSDSTGNILNVDIPRTRQKIGLSQEHSEVFLF